MTQTAPDAGEIFARLAFRYPFRKYEGMILAQVETGQGDRKYHIVAPPGSGKTIIGIELVRRFGAPAVIFAPTTTIQQQWQEKVGMFTGEEQGDIAGKLTSLDPSRLAAINIFTYQLISTPGQAQEIVQEMARQAWLEELVAEGQAGDKSAAEAHLAELQTGNPHEYKQELAHRYLRVKRKLLQQEDVNLGDFLHPNARRLIGDLVGYGVKTVVLDECHHLLDYWAIVLRYLIQQIPDVRVVGLTATLPDPESEREYENYKSLVGDVDFEVPTPAVVKEGDVAPYRDLVYFVQPTEREYAYLHSIQDAFEKVGAQLANSRPFIDWVAHLVLEQPGEEGGKAERDDFIIEQPTLSLAALRFLRHAGYPDASSLLPGEVEEEISMEDWSSLLERYAQDVLNVSTNPEDHSRLGELRQALVPFGLHITRQGLRHGSSPADLVLAMSEAKDAAVALILAEESSEMGERLRAVAVTDFEAGTSEVEHKLVEVLDRDAGSALRVFRNLARDPRTRKLHPVSVTGNSVMISADSSPLMLEHFNNHLAKEGLEMTCAVKETPFPDVLQLTGEGGNWSPGVYVPMLTEAFEAGITKCLVGTRGIFGEGWDSLSLNTLIDLTSATTSTAVQQLRGRCLRLDPSWPRKVAHTWDVVCVAPQFRSGDTDLKRLARRHSRYWGVMPTYKLSQDLFGAVDKPATSFVSLEAQPSPSAEVTGAEATGAVVKGVAHVDPDLAWDIGVKPFDRIKYDTYTVRMLDEIRWRERSYEMWGVGEDYSNHSHSIIRLQADDLKIRTVFTVQKSLKLMLREFLWSLALWVLFLLYIRLSPGAYPAGPAGVVGIILLAVATIALIINAFSAYRLGKALLAEQPPDTILLDVGKALYMSLKATGLLSGKLRDEYVQVIAQPDNSYQVLLAHASPEDAATFVEAYRQVFEPVLDQRYLVLRDESRLPNLALAPVWLVVRLWLRKRSGYARAYHPVPTVLASQKRDAEQYAQHWSRYVGGGRLVFTRSEEGRQILPQARAQLHPNVKSLTFEVWR